VKPYLIVTHDYNRKSAGGRALHRLCHYLNLSGGDAYVTSDVRNSELVTPLASPELQAEIAERGIVVYPEVEQGNRLGAKQVVRYVLNVPGRIRGDEDFDSSETVFIYSDILKRYVPNSSGTLTVPVVDLSIFGMDEQYDRYSWLHWVGKGVESKIDGLLSSMVADVMCNPALADSFAHSEITFDWPLTWEGLARAFRQSLLFVSFTPYTMLTVEARLCGCPVAVIPNSYFSREDFERAMPGMNGLAWGLDAAEVERARQTVGQFQYDYQESVAQFFVQFDRFIDKTQRWVR